jgi:CheY-like chemotaxis protein
MPAKTRRTVMALNGDDSMIDGNLQNRRTVLVVDDEIIVRMLIADELREAGYRVMEADNAEEALGLLHSGAVPALLVTDIRMPGVHDGLALARIAHQAYPEIKVVIVSGNLPAADNEAIDAMIAKPCEPAQLLAAVAALLAPGAMPGEATGLSGN